MAEGSRPNLTKYESDALSHNFYSKVFVVDDQSSRSTSSATFLSALDSSKSFEIFWEGYSPGRLNLTFGELARIYEANKRGQASDPTFVIVGGRA